MMLNEDEVLPYPLLKRHTKWAGCPLSEEYLIPLEDKAQLLKQLSPFEDVPGLDETLLDIHENREFVVRDFKVVREDGMNMLVSPYYYKSGGSIIDWAPVDDPFDDSDDSLEEGFDDDDEGDDDGDDMFPFLVGSIRAQRVKPGGELRLRGLIERQHEGPGL